MAGATKALPSIIKLPLKGELPAIGKRTEFVRAKLENGVAAPVNQQDSSGLAALSSSDLLIRRDIGATAAHDGQLVDCFLLENGGLA